MPHIITGNLLAIDTETTGLLPWHGDQPFCICFYNEAGGTATVEWPVDPITRRVIPDPQELQAVKDIFEDESVAKIFHNAKFDIRMMEQAYGIQTKGQLHETMFMAHICNPLEPTIRLKALAQKYLEYSKQDETDLKQLVISLRRMAKKVGWKIGDDVEQDYWLPRAAESEGWLLDNDMGNLCANYCVSDVERTMLLYWFYSKWMDEIGVRHTYEEEMKLWPVTYQMETRGIAINPTDVERYIREAEKTCEESKQALIDAAWPGFNMNSMRDLRELIYKKCKLPVVIRTEKTMEPSTSMEALLEHRDHPVINNIIKYKSAETANSIYFLNYKRMMIPDSVVKGEWILHANFNQVGPKTGRYSCRTPNIQNVANAITTHSTEPIQARAVFSPRKGYNWYLIDYSAVEVRIFADVAQDQILLKVLREGLNPHQSVAFRAWGGKDNPRAINAAIHALELDGSGEFTSAGVKEFWEDNTIESWEDLSRQDKEGLVIPWLEKWKWDTVAAEASLGKKTSYGLAKMLMFLKIFGGAANAAMKLLKCTRPEAQDFLDTFDEAMPRVKEFIDETVARVKRDGFVVTKYGRRLPVPYDKEYLGVNYIVQGSAAGLLKSAMLRVRNFLYDSGRDAHLIMCIHDELGFEIHKDHATIPYLRNICEIMADNEGHFDISTPVSIERVTTSWDKKENISLLSGDIYMKGYKHGT